jgi:recombination protein RecA
LSDRRPTLDEPTNLVISSGSLSIDVATGIGGFPRGRITEIIGPRSSGKSVLAFHVLTNAQHGGGFAAFIDSAHSVDLEQAGRCGVDLADLFLVVPQSAPEALAVAALLAESGGLDTLAIGPLSDLIGDARRDGREASDALARLNTVLRASPTAVVVLTNRDLRAASLPLARAMRHFATLRLALTPVQPLVHTSGDVLGLHVRAEITKNRLASPNRTAEVELRRDRGIHRAAEMVDLGLATGVLDQDAAGICFGRIALGRSRPRAIATLDSDVALAQAVSDDIWRVAQG